MLKLLNISKLITNVVRNESKYLFAINNNVTNVGIFARSNSQLQTIEKDAAATLNKLNESIEKSKLGRLFAVVHLCGKQFKITSGDIIIVEGYWPPDVGEKIKLEKVLAVGGIDFSLIGKPLINPNLINIEATIIEKTLSHTRTHFKKKRRKQFMRINFFRNQNTMVMINSIDLVKKI